MLTASNSDLVFCPHFIHMQLFIATIKPMTVQKPTWVLAFALSLSQFFCVHLVDFRADCCFLCFARHGTALNKLLGLGFLVWADWTFIVEVFHGTEWGWFVFSLNVFAADVLQHIFQIVDFTADVLDFDARCDIFRQIVKENFLRPVKCEFEITLAESGNFFQGFSVVNVKFLSLWRGFNRNESLGWLFVLPFESFWGFNLKIRTGLGR